MRIYTKSVHRLTNEEYMDAYGCNYSHEGRVGSMQDELERARRSKRSRSTVSLAYIGSTLAGAALGFRNHAGEWEVHVYVKSEYRKKGIGKRLLTRQRMGRKGQLQVNAHNPRAQNFFSHAVRAGRAVDIWVH